MSKLIDVGKDNKYVTTHSSQTTGIFDTILDITPEEGVFLGLEDNQAFIIKLLDSTGSEISLDSRLFLGTYGPGDTPDNPRKLAEKPYNKYSLSYSDQSNNKKKSGLKFALNLPAGEDEFLWNHKEFLILQANSGEEVVWSQTGCILEVELNRYLENPRT